MTAVDEQPARIKQIDLILKVFLLPDSFHDELEECLVTKLHRRASNKTQCLTMK